MTSGIPWEIDFNFTKIVKSVNYLALSQIQSLYAVFTFKTMYTTFHICIRNIHSSIPTTSIRTTSIRTTSIRTTSIRTTSIRTTSIRTTSIRTTSIRTTSIRITSIRTTYIRTTYKYQLN